MAHIDSYLSRVLSENGLSFLDDLYELYDFVPNETLRQLLAAFHTGLNKWFTVINSDLRYQHDEEGNIKYTGEKCFVEVGHPTNCGNIDMYGIARALTEEGFNGYVRPDHGRMIWGEKGRYGYGLFDRALGATYLTGLFEAIEKGEK